MASEIEQLRAEVEHWKSRHASTFQLYHRYFVAQQQTQKGLNRLVRKCQRQKRIIAELMVNIAAHKEASDEQ